MFCVIGIWKEKSHRLHSRNKVNVPASSLKIKLQSYAVKEMWLIDWHELMVKKENLRKFQIMKIENS